MNPGATHSVQLDFRALADNCADFPTFSAQAFEEAILILNKMTKGNNEPPRDLFVRLKTLTKYMQKRSPANEARINAKLMLAVIITRFTYGSDSWILDAETPADFQATWADDVLTLTATSLFKRKEKPAE